MKSQLPPVFEFTLPNGNPLRVVRKDIMDVALGRETTEKHLLERAEILRSSPDTFTLIKMLLRGRRWTPRQAKELRDLVNSGEVGAEDVPSNARSAPR